MEKEDPTVMGSPAPDVVNVITPEGVDHNINIPTKEKLSDDEMVGSTIDTYEQSPEKQPDVHEEDENIEPLSTQHLLSNELVVTPEGEDHNITISTKEKLSDDEMVGTTIETYEQSPEKEPDIHEEDQNIEPLSREDLLYNELAATEIKIKGQEEDNSTDNSSNLINTLTAEPEKEDQEKDNSINEILENTNSKEDRENSCVEKMEIEAHNHVQDQASMQDVSPATGDKETDPKDNTSSKKEESLVVYGSREPNSASALTKLVKVKGLFAVTNIFRRLSKRNNNDSDEKNVKEVNPEVIKEVNSQDKDEENKAATIESVESIAMKGRIVLYTRLWCQDCKKARLFLRKKRLRYSEINIDVYPGRKLELENITGSSDVPRVFFNHVPIGGLNDLKALDESGKLKEKIEYVTSQGPSPKAPLPPFSGEDDVSSSASVDELAVIVRKMKESIVVKDRFYKFRRVTNCFLGSEAVDFLSQDQFLERQEAIEFGRKLARELFFRHVLEENTFEDGNHLYRFLDQDPVISQCQNIPRGIIQIKRQPLVQLSHRLRFLLYAILEAYISEDGRHVAYRTIHGSEEFARFLRIAEELQRVDLNRTAKEERLAFFINLYNLMAIHAILVWGHPEGALDRRKLLNEFKYVIGGCAYSLSDIYNGILRSNQRPPYTLIKPFGIYDKRFKVCLPYPEPLIHFALVSGNRSAPALRCYSPKNIDMELVEAAHDFLQSGAFVLQLDSMSISVTKILKWYSVDFGKKEVEVLKHAANYLEVEKTRTLLELLDTTRLNVVYQPYDWRLNS